MTPRTAAIVALAGAGAVLGSCAPLGGAIYHGFKPAAMREVVVSPAHAVSNAEVTVTPGRRARIAFDLVLESASVQEEHDGAHTRYVLRYRFPAVLEVSDSDGAILSKESSSIAWSGGDGTRTTRDESVTANGGRLRLTYEFPQFKVPDDGVLHIDAALGPDTDYGAEVENMKLEVRHELVDHTLAVTFGIFMLIGGWIAAVVGVVLLITTAAAGPATALDPAAPLHAPTQQARQIAMFCHLAGFSGYFIPLGNVLLPLGLWLWKRELDPYIDEHGREALNFQLTMLAYLLIAFALVLILVGFLMLPLLFLFQVGTMIVGALRAHQGRPFRYPLTIRFLR